MRQIFASSFHNSQERFWQIFLANICLRNSVLIAANRHKGERRNKPMMYCSSCGAEVAQGISFCNRCGADLKPTETLISINKPKALPHLIVLSMILLTGLTIGGLATVLGILFQFFRNGFPIAALMILGSLSLIVILGSVIALSRQVSRLVNSYLDTGKSFKEIKKEKTSKILSPKNLAEIDAVPIQPIMSVTEHTTRTLDQAYREKQS